MNNMMKEELQHRTIEINIERDEAEEEELIKHIERTELDIERLSPLVAVCGSARFGGTR